MSFFSSFGRDGKRLISIHQVFAVLLCSCFSKAIGLPHPTHCHAPCHHATSTSHMMNTSERLTLPNNSRAMANLPSCLQLALETFAAHTTLPPQSLRACNRWLPSISNNYIDVLLRRLLNNAVLLPPFAGYLCQSQV